jgi:hypothetical protein
VWQTLTHAFLIHRKSSEKVNSIIAPVVQKDIPSITAASTVIYSMPVSKQRIVREEINGYEKKTFEAREA